LLTADFGHIHIPFDHTGPWIGQGQLVDSKKIQARSWRSLRHASTALVWGLALSYNIRMYMMSVLGFSAQKRVLNGLARFFALAGMTEESMTSLG
jgi:hypothetical protein